MRILMSYHYVSDPCIYAELHSMGFRILLDSGAYSAYTSGAAINLDEYCRFCKEVEPFVDGYIQLDKLFDQAGSISNLEYMEKKYNLRPIPVWQRPDGDFSSLEKWVGGRPWVAISAASGAVRKNKTDVKDWVWRRAATFSRRLPSKTRWHLLGATSERRVSQLRPSTCDSSTAEFFFVFGAEVKFFSPHYGKRVTYNFGTGSRNSYEALDAARKLLGKPNLPFRRLRSRNKKVGDGPKVVASDGSVHQLVWPRALACLIGLKGSLEIERRFGSQVYHVTVGGTDHLTALRYIKREGLA